MYPPISTHIAAVLLILLALFGGPVLGATDDTTAPDLVEASTDLLTVVAPPFLEGEAKHLSQRGAELLPRLENDLRQSLRQRVTIALIPKPAPSILQPLNAAAPSWAAGFMLPFQRLGAIRMDRVTSYPFNSSEMVLVHELTHLLLHDKVGRAVPRWFDEAVATHEGRTRGARDLFFFTSSTLFGRTPSLRSLDRAFDGTKTDADTAYAVSIEFLNWSLKTYGAGLVPNILDAVQARLITPQSPLDSRSAFEAAWQDATGVPLEISEQQWRRSAYRFTRWLPVLLSSNWLWVGMAALTFAAFLAKRRQKLEQYRRWEEEEIAEAIVVSEDGGTDLVN